MSRPPRLPKIDTQNVPNHPHSSLTIRPRNARLVVPSSELKQPLSAVERGKDMQVPDTPVVVPPTPTSSDINGSHLEDYSRDGWHENDERAFGSERNGKAAVNNRRSDDVKENNNDDDDDPDAEITIFESPSDEADAPSFPLPQDNDTPAANDDVVIFADSPAGQGSEGSDEELPVWLRKRMENLETSPKANDTTKKSVDAKGQGNKGIVHGRDFGIERQDTVLPPVGSSKGHGNPSRGVKSTRARSRSTSPEHHPLGLAPRPRRVASSSPPASETNPIHAETGEQAEITASPIDQDCPSPTGEAVPRASSPAQGGGSKTPPTASPFPSPSSATKSDSEVRLSPPAVEPFFGAISASPTASACETPCVNGEAHHALHLRNSYFEPLPEEVEQMDFSDQGGKEARETSGSNNDAERRNGDDESMPSGTKRDYQAEQKRVDSMAIAAKEPMSHSTQEMHDSRKKSESFGYDPPSAEQVSQARKTHHDDEKAKEEGNGTAAAGVDTANGKRGKERMLSAEDAARETSARARCLTPQGPHRRTSSTHRVRETLDAKHYSSEMGERLVNQFKIQELLGKGAYGNVYKAIDVGTGAAYALKEFSKDRLGRQHHLDVRHRRGPAARRNERKETGSEEAEGEHDQASGLNGQRDGDRADGAEAAEKEESRLSSRRRDPLQLIRREIAIMKKLDHPNLVLLYEAIDVPTSDSLYLVLEFMSGGTVMDIKLGDTTTPLQTEVAREYFRQLVLGLEYLHENDVAHRDIKTDNILLSEDRKIVKFCDFGVSEMFRAGDDRMKKSVGSPAFMSPEAAISSERDIHAKAVDIWSLGVTLYCMLRGRLPFEAANPLELFEAIRDLPVPVPVEWDDRVSDLIRRMLEKDATRRIVMADLREHAWVTFNGSEPLPSTEENLYTIGKHVAEPTQEELGAAITSFRQLLEVKLISHVPGVNSTVLKAIQKLMRNVKRRRRTLSTSSLASASTRTNDSPAPSVPGTPAAAIAERHKQWLLDVATSGEQDERGMTASPMMLPIAEGSGEGEGVERFTLGATATEKKEDDL
ncbi:hypothetical protein QFC21_006969 [Naganishia friedmannii]|uniref:Uncharacterized protein n=1 Tax=Naganishia friedmannii TaxID=89922 RepID=A0ACC2UZ37_9TREE|nr:hypothetical protein QFC21_006969 [Naganishia friedmannii]